MHRNADDFFSRQQMFLAGSTELRKKEIQHIGTHGTKSHDKSAGYLFQRLHTSVGKISAVQRPTAQRTDALNGYKRLRKKVDYFSSEKVSSTSNPGGGWL